MADYEALIRVVKTTLIGVGDFTVGLVLAGLVDHGFEQWYRHWYSTVPLRTGSATLTSVQDKLCVTGVSYGLGKVGPYPEFTDDGVTVQNPLCAPIPALDNNGLKVAGIVTVLQLVVTLVAGLELRNWVVPGSDFFDPTGGIVFVVALLMQPGLWGRADLILHSLYRALWWLEQPRKSETGNQS